MPAAVDGPPGAGGSAAAGGGGGDRGAEPVRRAVEAVWRIESARIVSTLARYTGDFALAEDVAQEAIAEALASWPRAGIPASPAGWLLTAARRRAVDSFRRRSALDERYALLAGPLVEGEAISGAPAPRNRPEDDLPWDPDRVDDDVLALMFMACHQVLAPEARVALTLRAVGGLSSEEIARAFLVPVPTVQARITRAKKTIAAAKVPFELPPAEERRTRLGGVLSVLYVIFTEGSTATSGDSLLRPDLAHEAIRLARMLAALLPDEPEVHGLLALCELTAARFPARTGPDGEAVLLADQDRRRWDRSAIRRGLAALGRATAAGRGLGPYGLQAAIAGCHSTAPSTAETDWERIVLLYEALGRVAPSPVVELNRAVAVAMANGPQAALAIVDELVATDRLAGSHLLPSVRGELLARLGRTEQARAELELAARQCRNLRERAVLLRKAAALPPA
ncbi:RNA polymerase subunit sigma-24 [Parafrankia colletiae]|uniref:RNA polymerase subunit sigma-24 n=2 Tax=Parafrankia colletiae TaxID=573497 RepID=A0A1S1QSW7_9ACTN|nr:RNA polymerase sigma factor [Parafrankia colletiae]MCK9903068.1 RNA polymerase sigma factor [Frankia sp. Cpl3]OHV35484.1 RNA polymerase subunit sigma-24 [Parafrankia colletiae]